MMLAALLAVTIAVPPVLLPPVLALPPAEVLARYADALAAEHPPSVLSFEYAVDQTGLRNDEQLHRVFRSGNDERDELLAVDGRRLDPPTVRIFHGRRDHYTLNELAPRPESYTFRYVGTHSVAKHLEYVFATTPQTASDFRVTQVTIDGIAFVPTSIAFETGQHDGSGTISFAHVDKYWVPLVADARGTYGNIATTERIAFMHYEFPPSLPSSTFTVSHTPPELPEDE